MTEDQFVQKPAATYTLATAGDRITASFSDGLIFLPIMLLDRSIDSLTSSQILIFVYFLVSQQLWWIYSVLFHGYRGQTLGKATRGIQVVRLADGGRIGYRCALLRDSPYIALCAIYAGAWTYSNIAWWGGWLTDADNEVLGRVYSALSYASIGWWLVEVISFSLHPQRRAIHDLIAGSIVIRKRSEG